MQVVLAVLVVVAATQGFFGLFGDEPPERPERPETGAQAAARADRFDAGAAWRLLVRQVEYGPRPAGSDASRALAAELRRLLPRGRFEAVPGWPGLRNVVGTVPGRRPAIVVGAHYDTEATVPGHVGANDGAAGTAAVVTLARAMARDRRLRPRSGREVRFVLFDGEEEAADGSSGGLRGSTAYVRAHRRAVGDMILLDYVANRGARFRREPGSHPRLWERLRRAARAVGSGALFPPGTQPREILDDHTPFARAGIPAIDIIDFDYRYRDTPQDTPDKLSRAVLDGVGEAVVELVRRM